MIGACRCGHRPLNHHAKSPHPCLVCCRSLPGEQPSRPCWSLEVQPQHVCTWEPHAKTLLKSCCGRYQRVEPIRPKRRLDPYALLPILVMSRACQLVWWPFRGSAYGIWLCLRPQLSVPAEGYKAIGRGIRALWNMDSDILLFLPALMAMMIPVMAVWIFLLFLL